MPSLRIGAAGKSCVTKSVLGLVLFALLFWASGAQAAEAAATAEPSGFDPAAINPVLVLFTTLLLGLSFGKIKICGLSFGSSGVLFAALLLGHFGFRIPSGIGKIGLVLFVFCVGLSAGPGFFSAFAKKGIDFVKLSLVAVLSGAVIAFFVAKILNINADLVAGIFAGALTSTPALAAAMEALPEQSGMVSIGYGIAYPFGVIGVVLFIQLLPRILKQDLQQIADQLENGENGASRSVKESEIMRTAVEVLNPSLFGKIIAEDIALTNVAACCISRVLKNGRFVPLQASTAFEKGQILLVISRKQHLEFIVEHLGRKSDVEQVIDADNERMEVVLTAPEFIGKTLAELNPLKNHGVTVSRIIRNGTPFIGANDIALENGDTLIGVGALQDLHSFAKTAGHKTKALHVTDIVSLAAGISLGVLLGMLPIQLPGMKPFSLGMAGGPLFLALILGHFGRIGSIYATMPKASNMLLMDLGLVFFLASAGIKAGGSLVSVLMEHGAVLILAGALITILPMLSSYFIAVKFWKMNILEALGGICGGMTSTPALGILSNKVDSSVPVTSYATAYPVALILMTVCAQILITILS